MPERNTQAYLTLGLLALVWGSSYILIKKSLVSFEPSQVGNLRLAIAGLVFVPLAWRRCRGLPATEWLLLVAIGLCGTGLPSFLFPLAQLQISSSLAAIFSSLTPLLTLLVGVVFFGAALRRWQGVGIAVGLAGVVGLILVRFGPTSLVAGGAPLGSMALAVLAALCYATSSNLVKRFFPQTDPLRVTAAAMVPLGVLGLGGLVLGGGLSLDFGADGPLARSYLAVLFLGLVGTALASWLFFRLVQLTTPVFASTVSYLVPVVALGWGLIDGEEVSLALVACLAVVLLGVNLSKR